MLPYSFLRVTLYKWHNLHNLHHSNKERNWDIKIVSDLSNIIACKCQNWDIQLVLPLLSGVTCPQMRGLAWPPQTFWHWLFYSIWGNVPRPISFDCFFLKVHFRITILNVFSSASKYILEINNMEFPLL